ncbi:hypothetical protein KKA47_01275, partial [bacterium]|nr:hypothetical protein [bacterium]
MTDNFKIQGVYFFDESKCKEEYKDGCTSNTYNCSTALESVVDAKYFADPDSYFGGEKKGQRIEFAYDGKIYYGKIDEKKSEVQFYLKGTTDTEIGSPVKYNPGAGEIYLVAIQEKETSNPEFAFQYDKSRIDEYIEDKLSKLARLGRNKTYEKKTKKTKKVGAPFMLFELNSGYSTRPERPSSSYMSEHVKGVKLNEDGGPFNRDGWMFDIGIGRDFLPNLEHDLIVDGHAGYAAGAERFFVGGPSLRYRWNFIPRWLGIELGVIDMVQLASDQPHVAGFNFATQALVTFYPVRNDKFEMGINAGWRGELYNTARYDFSDSGWSGEANALVFGLEFRGVRKDKEYDHSETLNCSNNPIKPYVHVNEAGDASVVEYKQGDVKIDIKLINFHPPLVIQSKETTPLFTWSTDDVKRVTVTNPKAEYEPYAMKDISRDIFISLTKLAGDYIKAGRNKNEAYIVIDGFAWVGAGGEGRANYDLTWEMASHAMIKYPHERGPEMKGQPDTLMDWLMVKDRLFKGGMPKIDGVTIKSVKDFTQEDYDNYPDADKEKIEAAYNQGRFLKIQAVNERTGEAFTAVLEFRPRGVGERPDIPDAAIKNRALDAAEGNIRNELKTGDYAVHYQRVMRRFTSADGTIDEATINKLPKDQKIELVRRIVLEAHTKKIEAEYDDEGSVSSELWRDYDMQHYSHSLFPWNKDKPNGWEHGKHSNGIEIKIRASQPEKQEGYEYLYEGRLETNSAALADIYQTRFSIA